MPDDVLNEVLTATEAAALWGLSESTVKRACLRKSKGIQARKSGKVWLVARVEMERVYGPQPQPEKEPG